MKPASLPKVVRRICLLMLCIVCLSTNLFSQGVRLSLARSQSEATLSWPLSTKIFVLESATRPDAGDWERATHLFTITDGQCAARVSLSEGQRYFRLREVQPIPQPPPVEDGLPTVGYITAVLRSDCASAPPPPPVGHTVVGSNYVIKTVADGDPMNYLAAQQLVTDSEFQSLMSSYCGLPDKGCGDVILPPGSPTNQVPGNPGLPGNPPQGISANRVQWNLLTYDLNGNPRVSGSPLSGAGFHYCSVTDGYIVAVVRGSAATLPSPPPVGQVAIGTDAVIMTIADGNPADLNSALTLATDAVFQSLMQRYCALPRGTGAGQVSGQPQWHVATYEADGTPRLSGCAASGCGVHACVVTRGFITAVLRSECTDVPAPPPVGQTSVGADYVIMTIADGDPDDYTGAQKAVTDDVFESLMPLYCTLPRVGCVTDRVQWNLVTYDAGGNPRISGAPVSGYDYHFCH